MHWVTAFDEELFDYCLEGGKNNATLFNNLDFYSGKLEPYLNDSSVVFRGPLNLINKLKAKGYHNIWIGDEFLCSYYVKFIRNCLINKDYEETTLQYLLDNWESYFKLNNKLFVRPDSYNKIFPGLVISKPDKDKFRDQLKFYLIEDYSIPIFTASHKNITKEYRFVCSQKYVITGCQYMENGEPKVNTFFPKEALMYVQPINKFVSKIIPYPFYIIDIGYHLGGYGIVEINAFNTSGLYSCNLKYIDDNVTKEIHGF